jgi:hypothetical protein
MAHVQVDAARIGEEAAVPRRLIMTAVVQIKDTAPLNVKHLIANAMGKPGGGMFGAVLIDQQAIFSFEPKDPIEHDRESG